MAGLNSRTAAAATGHPSSRSGAAAPLTAAVRAEVSAKLVGLARPHLAGPGDLLAWSNELDPDRYAFVARLLLAPGTTREPARRLPAPGLDESVAEAIARYDIKIGVSRD